MAEKSKIDWTDNTVNVWIGCNWVRLFISEEVALRIQDNGGQIVRKVGPDGHVSYWVPSECDKCYAEWWARVRKQYDGRDTEHPVIWGNPKTTPRIQTKYWRGALRKWNREAADGRLLVFAFSLSDWAEEHAMVHPWRREFLEIVEQTGNLDYLLLTKRIQNVPRLVPSEWVRSWPQHAWVGTSTGTNAALSMRIRSLDRLAEIGAPVRFLSVEPQLEDLTELRPALASGTVNWVITGGESGSADETPEQRARIDADPDWFRRVRDLCGEYSVAYFHKQAGGARPGTGKELDGRLWHQWPDTRMGRLGGVRTSESAELVP